MKRLTAFVTAAVFVVGTASAFAQAKPSLPASGPSNRRRPLRRPVTRLPAVAAVAAVVRWPR